MTAVASIGAFYLNKPGPSIDDSTTEVLILEQPFGDLDQKFAGDESEDPLVFNEAAKILRECGAWYFETEPVGLHIPGKAMLPIIAENTHAIECAILAAHEAKIPMTFESQSSPNMNEILKSANAPAPNEE